jgi:hypothetical protein
MYEFFRVLVAVALSAASRRRRRRRPRVHFTQQLLLILNIASSKVLYRTITR